jgi:hypothetical protein
LQEGFQTRKNAVQQTRRDLGVAEQFVQTVAKTSLQDFLLEG